MSKNKPQAAKGFSLPTREIALLAVMLAMEIILSRFLSVYITQSVKLSFAFIPLAIASRRTGPLGGATVGAVADLLGAILFPVGPYFYGFTVTAALSGIVYGLILRGKIECKAGLLKIIAAAVVQQVVCSFLLNSFWLSQLYGNPLVVVMASRFWLSVIMIPVQILILTPVLISVDRAIGAISVKSGKEQNK